MVPHFNVPAKALAPFMGLLLLTLLPSIEGSKDLKKLSSNSVENKDNNVNLDLVADPQARLDIVDNKNTVLNVNGGSLKIRGTMNGRVSLKDSDLVVTNCLSYQISGQKNKGHFWNFFDSNFTGNDNELDVADCSHCDFHLNKTTILVGKSNDLRVQDTSNSKVTMARVDSVQVSGRDFTLEGSDIKLHTFLGKSCTEEKVTHSLTFLPKRPTHPDHASYYWDIERNVYIHGGIFIHGALVLGPNQRVNNKKPWPLSLHFCNAAKVINSTYEIGGLPHLTIETEGEDNTANIRVTEGNPECKIVSEEGKMKVSISTSSEELVIEGAKDIRRVEDGKCEFILSLGKDDLSADEKVDDRHFSPAMMAVFRADGERARIRRTASPRTTTDDKDKDSMLGSLVAAANNALDLARSYFHKFFM